MRSSAPEAEVLRLIQAGQLAEAEGAARALLGRKPGDAQATHLLGLVVAQTGRREEGLELLDRSIAGAAPNAPFLANRARILADMGRGAEAERDLRNALRVDPSSYIAYCQLGGVLRGLRRHVEARAAFRRALAIDARGVEAYVGLGNVLRDAGDQPGALAAYDAALGLRPRDAMALYNRGTLRLDMGEGERAIEDLRAMLEREPRHSPAWNNLGVALRGLGRHDEALEAFERAVAADPGNPGALSNLGLALQQFERTAEAMERYSQAVKARPDSVDAIVNWASALRSDGDFEGAWAMLRRAMDTGPESAELLSNSASVAIEVGRLDEARRLYERASALDPTYANARFGFGQVDLRQQRFEAGWEAIELRFDTTPPMAERRAPALPALTREGLVRGRRIAVWAEQGVGDQILYSTLLPDLERSGVRAVVEVDRRLIAMYRRSLPGMTFVAGGEAAAEFAACDAQVAIGSLPRFFRPDVHAFAAQPKALLAPDPRRVEAMRARLGEGPWIAIAWRSVQSGDRKGLAARKSIPLERFARLAQEAGARLLDLQYGDVDAERAAFEVKHPGVLMRLEDLDTYKDLEGIVAAMQACERVVTASNANAHLAGAIGKPTTLAFVGTAPFHYWVPGPDGRSLWYPSVEVMVDPEWARG